MTNSPSRAETMSAAANAAQRRASSPLASVWVGASAGAGKTKVLADRVLRLMLAGTPPGKILCLTFTRAASAEMANRINNALGAWCSASPEKLTESVAGLTGETPAPETLARARRLFAEVLDTPGGMKIQTIHAFCESLLGRFPLEAGVAPHFEVMDERTAAEAMREARDLILIRSTPETDPELAAAMEAVTGWVGEDEFTEIMTGLARDRGRLRRMLHGEDGFDRFVARLCKALDVDPNTSPNDVIAASCGDAEIDGAGLRRAAEGLRQGSAKDRQRGELIRSWLDGGDRRPELFEAYTSAFLTKDRNVLKTLATKAVLALVPDADDVLRAEGARIVEILDRFNAHQIKYATAALARIAKALIDTYDGHKSQQALLDYDDLILRARALLEGDGGASWVLYKLDGGIDHVLIDEAQDTNPDQWAVVRALTEEFFAGETARDGDRTVFAVGDEKQSIFSFQRADPAEFAKMNRYFAARAQDAGRRWDTVGLDISFRSANAVLRAVDATFAVDAVRAGVAADPIAHRAHRSGQAGRVEIWPAVAPSERETPEPWAPNLVAERELPPAERLAEILAQQIKSWIDSHEPLPSRARAIRPGDVMVLVRRRTDFVDALVRRLKNLKVPVAGVDRMVLTDQLAIMDLVALGEFLLLPEDDLTLATVLKGPLFGLDDDALLALCHGRGDRSLWSRLRGHDGGAPEIAAAAETLADLLGRVDYRRPFELYSEILGPGGGRKRVVARLGEDANDPIDEFLSLALAFERGHAASLEGFLRWFAAGDTEIKRDLEHGVRDEVRIMTVHGAKGLQAPVVIMADTMQVPRPSPRLLWIDAASPGGPVLIWAPRKSVEESVSRRLKGEVASRGDEEYRRLLYVAMTRAEDRLYVCGYATRTAPPENCWYNIVRRGLEPVATPFDADFTGLSAAEGWLGEGLRLEEPQAATADKIAKGSALSGKGDALPDWASAPPAPEPTPNRPLNPSRPDDEDAPVRSPLGPDGANAYRRGNVIHRLLQSLPDVSPANREAAARRYLREPGLALTEEDQTEILASTFAVLDNPDFADLFGPESRAEVPLVGLADGRAVSARVDRLLVGEGVVKVVDYKTNRPAPATPDGVAPLYLRQMASYRALLQEIYPDFSITCAILWTDGPKLMRLDPALLDRTAS